MTSPNEPRRPKGKPLDLTDEDLDALAEITEADILRAQQRWQRSADPQYKNLLLAEEEEPDDLQTS